MGKSWDNAGVSFQKETWEAVYRVLKPGAFLLAFGGTRTWHRIAVAIEDAGFEIRDTICWLYGQGFPKSYNISKGIDKKAGKEREKLGVYAERGINKSLHGRADPDDENYDGTTAGTGKRYITKPATPEAELWEGWGTALKPAFEPIIVAMKPRDDTYVNNALTHSVAGMWISGGSLITNPKVDDPRLGGKGSWKTDKAAQNVYEGGYEGKDIASSPDGRFPSNVILDEVSAEMLDKQTGILKSGDSKGFKGEHTADIYGKYAHNQIDPETVYADSGGASRFFYCAKAGKKERNLGMEEVPEQEVAYSEYRENYKETKDFVTHYPDGSPRPVNKTKNAHPTVKPLSLMKYLARLTRTPTGGIVIDPFMGSGTTGMACVLEDRYFIGIEMNEEYYEIAKLRIKYAMKNRDELLTKYK
jgi:site-specific DNA-methyltransferase (adenine-specific)